MNFFDPLLTSDGTPYAPLRYKAIIEEQVVLSYLTKGGVTYQDSDNMTPYERKIAMDTIKDLLEGQNKAQREAIEQAKLQKQSDIPKSGLHH